MAQNEKLPQNENNPTNNKVAMGDNSDGNPLKWFDDLKMLAVTIGSAPAAIQESGVAIQALYRSAAVQIAKVFPALQKALLQTGGNAAKAFEKLGENFTKEAVQNVAKNLNISVKEVWQGIAKSDPKIAIPFQNALQKMHTELANAINKIPYANTGINEIFNKGVLEKVLNGSSKHINNQIGGIAQNGTQLKRQLDAIMKLTPQQVQAKGSNLLDKLLKIVNSTQPAQKPAGIQDPPAGAFKPKLPRR